MISCFQEIKYKSSLFSLCFIQRDGSPGSTVSYFFSPVLCQKKEHACVLASSSIKNNALSGVCGISVYEILSSGSLEWTDFIHPAFSSSLEFFCAGKMVTWDVGQHSWNLCKSFLLYCHIFFFISTVVIHCPRYQHWLAGRKCAGPIFVARRHTECQRSEDSVP